MELEKYKILEPIQDKVVIKKLDGKSQTSGGILMLEEDIHTNTGIVVAVGPGQRHIPENKQLLTETKTIYYNKPTINVGDKVLYSNNFGVKMEFEDEELIIQRENEILCKLK